MGRTAGTLQTWNWGSHMMEFRHARNSKPTANGPPKTCRVMGLILQRSDSGAEARRDDWFRTHQTPIQWEVLVSVFRMAHGTESLPLVILLLVVVSEGFCPLHCRCHYSCSCCSCPNSPFLGPDRSLCLFAFRP